MVVEEDENPCTPCCYLQHQTNKMIGKTNGLSLEESCNEESCAKRVTCMHAIYYMLFFEALHKWHTTTRHDDNFTHQQNKRENY